ncbi:MAG: MCE family protein [Rhodobacteraceae bacterium]|nr:MCE family protein [Paracoccaceae bacterium]
MESKANYALIGTFVLIAVFLMVGFSAYLSGRGLSEKLTDYIVVYTTPPRGISVGSEVRYNGLKMGEVTQTRLDPDDQSKVLVYIRVKETTPVMEDTYGQLEALGLTGLSLIQLFPGDSLEHIEPQAMFGDVPRIEGRASQFDDLLGGSESVIKNVNVALGRIVSVLNPEATEDFHDIIRNVNTITGAMAQSDLTSERINQFLDAFEQAALDVSTAALAIEVTAKDVSIFLESDEIKNVLAQAETTLKSAEDTLAEYTTLAQHGTIMTDEAARMVEQFSATGLQDLSTSMTALRDLMESLNRVIAELERNPIEFVIGQEKEIMELPQ